MSKLTRCLAGWSMIGMIGACDIVDETGYERCEDGTLVSDPSMCPPELGVDMAENDDSEVPASEDSDELAPPDDGTGGGGGAPSSLIAWTAETSPDLGPVPILVLGLIGSVPAGSAVELHVAGQRAGATVVQGTSFVGSVEAANGVEVSVLVDGGFVSSLVVGGLRTRDTDLAAAFEPAPDVGAGAASTIGVGDGRLALPAPYVVFNRTSGAVVSVETGDLGAEIPAREGDALCVAPVVGLATLGTSGCVVVR